MAHQTTHPPFTLLTGEDYDRTVALLRNGLLPNNSGILALLEESLSLQELNPELQAALTGFARMPVVRESFVADGITAIFATAAIPLPEPEQVFLNGVLQRAGTDYTLSGTTLTFLATPSAGDLVDIVYTQAGAIVPIVLTHYTLPYKDITDMIAGPGGEMILRGTNKIGLIEEISVFRSVDVVQLIPPITVNAAVNVDSGIPDRSSMVRAGGFVWAIGASSGTNRVSRINETTLAFTVIDVTTDTAAMISSMESDGAFVYAFMKGGTFIAPNTTAKLDFTGAPVGVIGSGLTVTGATDLEVSTTGFLYAAFADPSVKEVRKFDVAPPGTLLETHVFVEAPVHLLALDDKILVTHGTKLSRIDTTDDTVILLQDYGFAVSVLSTDGIDLWIATGDTLHKTDPEGNILHTLVPQAGKVINAVLSAFGAVWVSYQGDSTINLTRVWPGIPGV